LLDLYFYHTLSLVMMSGMWQVLASHVCCHCSLCRCDLAEMAQ